MSPNPFGPYSIGLSEGLTIVKYQPSMHLFPFMYFRLSLCESTKDALLISCISVGKLA